MRLTKERKLCAGVLSLAVIALGVDRFVLGGAAPSEAAALVVEPTAHADAPAPAPPRPDDARATAIEPVAKRLESLAHMGDERADGFALPPRWRAVVKEEEKKPEADPAAGLNAELKAALDRWREGKKLVAVMNYSDEQRRAVFIETRGQRRLVSARPSPGPGNAGNTLDGWTLKEITPFAAIFTDPSGKVEARLAMGADAEMVEAGGRQ